MWVWLGGWAHVGVARRLGTCGGLGGWAHNTNSLKDCVC